MEAIELTLIREFLRPSPSAFSGIKISWNKNAQPSHSILKKQVDWDETYKRKNDQNSDITNQLNEIGRSLEKLSTILLKEKNECSLESLDINTDEDHQTSSTPVSIPPNKKVRHEHKPINE